jgi:AbrB family looped-hinge helix DNA binding protein
MQTETMPETAPNIAIAVTDTSTVTSKGQVTIPISLRRKYGIKKSTTILFEDSPSGIILKVIPNFIDLIGADAGKSNLEETLAEIDKMRSDDW